MTRIIDINHVPGPEPVFLPDNHHFLDRNVLGLGQEEEDENGHYHHPERKEEEETELEVAEHGQEDLRDDEREDHVDRHVDTLSSRSDFQREDFTRD